MSHYKRIMQIYQIKFTDFSCGINVLLFTQLLCLATWVADPGGFDPDPDPFLQISTLGFSFGKKSLELLYILK